jgi:hypothetical protein
MKTYIVPCFVVVRAECLDHAHVMAACCQPLPVDKRDTVILLDEELPSLEIEQDWTKELPHSLTRIEGYKNYFRS